MTPLQWLLRAAIRATYYPSLAFNWMMCALGVWNAWDTVDETVLLGRIPSRRDVERLHGLGVRTIINMCEEFAGHESVMRRLGIKQLRLPTLDYREPSADDLLRGVRFIEQHRDDGRVYVHCKAGRGRGATLALAYLMCTYNLSATEAYKRLKAARRQVNRGLDRRPAIRQIAASLDAPGCESITA